MLTRRHAVMGVLLLGLLPLWPSIVRAVPPVPAAPDDSDFTMEGKITDKSPGKLTINSGDNMIFHVVYTDTTEIKKKDGSAGTAEDLHRGLKISVVGSLGETGEIAAKRIEILPDGADKP